MTRAFLAALLSPFRRQRTPLAPVDDADDWQAYQDAKLAAGWWRYEWKRPPAGEIVEFDRFGWERSDFFRASEMRPEMNVAGLWWRPVQHEIEGGVACER